MIRSMKPTIDCAEPWETVPAKARGSFVFHDCGCRFGGLGRKRLLAILAVTACLCGCETLPRSAIQQIRQGHIAYEAGNYALVDRLVSPVIAEHGSHPDIAKALYLRALGRLRVDNRPAAENDLRRARVISRDRQLIALIEAQWGHLRFADNQYAQAIEHYRAALGRLPTDTSSDEIRFCYGVSQFRVGRFADGRATLNELVREHPTGLFTSAARRTADWSHDYFVIQAGAFAKSAGAQAEARRWKALGKPVGVSVSRHDGLPTGGAGQTHYLVHVGRYSSFAAAQSDLPEMRSVASDAFVVP